MKALPKILLLAVIAVAALALAGTAQIGLRIDPNDSGGLAVSVDAAIDGQVAAAGTIRPIGRIGVYHWQLVGAGIEVAIARVALAPPVLSALNAAAPIDVPERDRQGFLAEAYPAIARQTAVSAPDVALPTLAGVRPPASTRCGAIKLRIRASAS